MRIYVLSFPMRLPGAEKRYWGYRTRQTPRGERMRLCSSSVPFGMTSGHGLNP